MLCESVMIPSCSSVSSGAIQSSFIAHPTHASWRSHAGTDQLQQQNGGGQVHRSLAEGDAELASQWHPLLNDPNITPDTVSLGSNVRATWLCPHSTCQHPHVWEAIVRSRARLGSGCPFCTGQKVCPCNSLAGPISRDCCGMELDQEWQADA